jgi:hypothetical protein
MFIHRLGTVVHVRDREVGGKNGHGIAEDQVLTSIEDSLLTFWEMMQAEET